MPASLSMLMESEPNHRTQRRAARLTSASVPSCERASDKSLDCARGSGRNSVRAFRGHQRSLRWESPLRSSGGGLPSPPSPAIGAAEQPDPVDYAVEKGEDAPASPAQRVRVCLFTDECFQPWQATNASRLHEARKVPDPEADGALAEALRSVNETISVADLCEIVGLPCRGYAAILRAIHARKLTLTRPGVIEPKSLLAREIAR